jgi:hypothetical protein
MASDTSVNGMMLLNFIAAGVVYVVVHVEEPVFGTMPVTLQVWVSG